MVSLCEILWICFYQFSLFYETNSLIHCSGDFRYKLISTHGVMKLHGHYLVRTLNALFKKVAPFPHPVLGTSKYSPHTHTKFLLKSTLILSFLLCKRLKVACFPNIVLHISYECVIRYAHFIILDFITTKYLARSTNYEASHQP